MEIIITHIYWICFVITLLVQHLMRLYIVIIMSLWPNLLKVDKQDGRIKLSKPTGKVGLLEFHFVNRAGRPGCRRRICYAPDVRDRDINIHRDRKIEIPTERYRQRDKCNICCQTVSLKYFRKYNKPSQDV